VHRHRLATAAAVIALPFALAACSSNGTSGAGALGAVGQKSVQVNSSSAAGAPKDAPTPTSQNTASSPDSETTTSGSGSDQTSGSDTHSYVASSAFCAAMAKASDDSTKMDAGDPSVTNTTAMQDLEATLAAAPAAVKSDMQTVVDAARTAIANGQDVNSGKGVSPEADAAGDRVLSWASANCTLH
jgi:hypothetical protein